MFLCPIKSCFLVFFSEFWLLLFDSGNKPMLIERSCDSFSAHLDVVIFLQDPRDTFCSCCLFLFQNIQGQSLVPGGQFQWSSFSWSVFEGIRFPDSFADLLNGPFAASSLVCDLLVGK